MTVVEQAKKAQETAVTTAKDVSSKVSVQAKELQGRVPEKLRNVDAGATVAQLREQAKGVNAQEILDDVQSKVKSYELPSRDEVKAGVSKALDGLNTYVTSLADRVKEQVHSDAEVTEAVEAEVTETAEVAEEAPQAVEEEVAETDDEAATA